MLYCASCGMMLLCCAVLCCAVLCCAVLCCAVLCCAACPALPCPALPCPALPCPALPCPALPCPALPCPALPPYHQLWTSGAQAQQQQGQLRAIVALMRWLQLYMLADPAATQPDVAQDLEGVFSGAFTKAKSAAGAFVQNKSTSSVYDCSG